MKIFNFQLPIIKIIDETPDTKIYRFKYPDDPEFTYKPGQFIGLSFPDGREIGPRAFSISSTPTRKEYLEFTIKRTGPFTTKLFENGKVGTLMNIKGVYGLFYVDENEKNNLIFIAGGSGIAPIIGMLRFIVDKKLPIKATLLYSNKTKEDIIFHDELIELRKKDNINCIFTLTRNHPEDWDGQTGRINKEMIKHLVEDFLESKYFICGPTLMVEEMQDFLQSLNIEKEKIIVERWG